MQIGIDLGATKIEYVLLDNNNKELERNRSETPKDFAKTIIVIKDIIEKLQKKYRVLQGNKSDCGIWYCSS